MKQILVVYGDYIQRLTVNEGTTRMTLYPTSSDVGVEVRPSRSKLVTDGGDWMESLEIWTPNGNDWLP